MRASVLYFCVQTQQSGPMANLKRYPIAKSLRQMTSLLKLDAGRVLRRAGLSDDFLDGDARGVTAAEFFSLWDAMYGEIGNPNFALETGQKFAGSPFIPAMLAFSSSPNTEIGLTRLALFKPLVGPIQLDVQRIGETVALTIRSSDPSASMPASASAFELVYFLESVRMCTGCHVVPLEVGVPEGVDAIGAMDDYFGVVSTPSGAARITLSLVDAHRPLVSENAEFWKWLEIDFRRQLAERTATTGFADRVRAVLIDLLPSGDASSDAVCRRLGMSKRSLQRKLNEEGEAFQSVLDATREELAIRYLGKKDMSVEEISYLLAYRDPNSFYRAFHNWTGLTPSEARGQTLQARLA